MSESESSAAVFKSRAKALAALMESGEERSTLWQADELASIFRHQMNSPMLVDLGGFDPRTAHRLESLGEAKGLVLRSFADLFHHPAPPLELLELVKDFAKANVDHPESGLPSDIASALYYASIAAALVRLKSRISKLTDADLRRGLDWALTQPWLDQKTKGLVSEALQELGK